MEYPESYYDQPAHLQKAFRKRVDLAVASDAEWKRLEALMEASLDPIEEDRMDSLMVDRRAEIIDEEWTHACREGLFTNEDEETENMTKGNSRVR